MLGLFVTAQLIFVLSCEIALITFVIYVNLLGQPLLLLVIDQVLLFFLETNYQEVVHHYPKQLRSLDHLSF